MTHLATKMDFLLGVLDDYCALQTSGAISGAGRYAVSDVRAVADEIEKAHVDEFFKHIVPSEQSLANVVITQKRYVDALEERVKTLEQILVTLNSLMEGEQPVAIVQH